MGEGVVFGQVVYGLTALSAVVLAPIVWRYRSVPGARPLLGSIFGGFLWSLSLFVAATPWGYERLQTVGPTMYVGVVIVVASVFVFALEYAGREHLVTPKLLVVLSIEPILAVVFALWNPEGLFMTIWPVEALSGIRYEFGALFWIHTAYSYTLIGIGWLFVFGMFFRTGSYYRGQVVALVVGIITPTVANMLSITKVVYFSAAPIGFMVANALFAVGIIKYRLVDVAPIARDRVVNHVTEAMVVVDRSDRVIDINPAARELFASVTDGDMIGAPAQDLIGHIPDAVEGYETIVAGETDEAYEFEIDGNYYEGYATPIEDRRDRIVGWLFLIRDVTEQRLREQELERRNEQLNRFAGVVSHDLRNPLSVATGRAEFAYETGDLDHLEHVIDAHERMEAIVDDVLAIARGGDAVTDPSPIALDAAAERAWKSVASEAATLTVATDLTLVADRDRLIRLLENLFQNAVEHGSTNPSSPHAQEDAGRARSSEPSVADAPEDAPEHGSADPPATPTEEALNTSTTEQTVGDASSETHEHDPAADDGTTRGPAVERLTIEVGALRSQAGECVGFYVADNGVGIPADERETVLESGYTTREGGTGFGLAIVSEIASAHGWTVDVTESAAGGARFEFRGVQIDTD